MITIIDYGMGNIGSIQNMLKKIGSKTQVTRNIDEIDNSEKLILPGVGAFDAAMQKIEDYGLKQILDKKALHDKVPILGICLGMQLLTNGSEEGKLPGLGWINATTKKFIFTSPEFKIPHMGWNMVKKVKDNPLTEGFTDEYRFYHVHSYYVTAEDKNHAIIKTTYDITFDSGINKDNIFGVQFHPEKSHKFGMKLFENFVKI